MMDGSRIRGAIPALITPLDDDGRPDLTAFERHVHRAVDHGFDAVLVAGSTGEGPLLTPDDRAGLVRAAASAAGGVPVLACVCGLTLDDLHREAERAAAAGAAAVLCLAPFYFPLSPAEQVAAYHAVADRAATPLLAYHFPQLTGSALTPEAVADLAAHPQVVGMKDSSGDLQRLRRFVAATRGRSFGVFPGSGRLVLDGLRAGAAGSITAVANVRPAEVVAVHAAVAESDLEAARGFQNRLAAVSALLDEVPGPLAVAIKALLELEGELANRRCVPPLAAAAASSVEHLKQELGRL